MAHVATTCAFSQKQRQARVEHAYTMQKANTYASLEGNWPESRSEFRVYLNLKTRKK